MALFKALGFEESDCVEVENTIREYQVENRIARSYDGRGTAPENEIAENTILQIFESVAETWRSEIYTNWLPLQSDHCCIVHTNRKQKRTREDVYKSAESCVLENIPFTLYRSYYSDYHPCIKGHCTQTPTDEHYKVLHHTKLMDVYDLYMCTYSGRAHVCGNYCRICMPKLGDDRNRLERVHYEKTIYNRDGTLTCPLTAICFDAQKIVHKISVESSEALEFEQKRRMYKEYTDAMGDGPNDHKAYNQVANGNSNAGAPTKLASLYHRRTKTSTDDHYVVVDLVQKIQGILKSTTRVEVSLKTVKKDQFESLKHFYLTLAALKIADMLAPVRLNLYEENNERKTQKLIKPFTSYINKCFQQGDTPNVCELSTIMRTEEKTIYTPPLISIPLNLQTQLVLEYARLTVCAWYAIVTKTVNGRNEPGNFKFTDFIEAFISMVKNGYSVQTAAHDVIEIYHQDVFLNMIPNMDEEERKKGDYPSKHKRKHVAQMKKNIQRAIHETILKERTHFSLLSPYSYQFDDLDDASFVPIKEWQKCKKQKTGREGKGTKGRKKGITSSKEKSTTSV